MPFGRRSRAKDWANPRLAKLPGPNAIELGPALTPAVAPVKSIAPLPRAIIAGAHSLAAEKSTESVDPHAVLELVGGDFVDVAQGAGRSVEEEEHFRFAQSRANQFESAVDVLWFACIRLHLEGDASVLADVSRKLMQEIE
jgi:hypothetical protein